ncbi:AIR synthase-related protein, partial [Parasphingorhabdus sp.]
EEMARTFNCGIGMVLAVSPVEANAITADLEAAGETVHQLGDVREGTKGCSVSGARGIWSATSDWTATHNG